MTKKSQHVVPHADGSWGVRSTGSKRYSRRFNTQKEAVTYAKHLAEKAESTLYIHRHDGLIKSRAVYSEQVSTFKK